MALNSLNLNLNLNKFSAFNSSPSLCVLYIRNTVPTVVKVTNDILRALDSGQCVYLVLLDLSAGSIP